MNWLDRNPFTDDYAREEIAFYGFPKGRALRVGDEGGADCVLVGWTAPFGRVDDYLNLRFRFRSSFLVPYLAFGGRTWMSLTPMELQSQHMPIGLSHGRVATAGLGMGHFVKRAMMRPEVKEIVVYERSWPVIRAWEEVAKASLGGAPLWDEYRQKVQIVHGDARRAMRGQVFDFVYMDVYHTMLQPDALEDIAFFRRHNQIGFYTFWGRERAVLDAWKLGVIGRDEVSEADQHFFEQWATTPSPYRRGNTLENLYGPVCDKDTARHFVEAMREDL